MLATWLLQHLHQLSLHHQQQQQQQQQHQHHRSPQTPHSLSQRRPCLSLLVRCAERQKSALRRLWSPMMMRPVVWLLCDMTTVVRIGIASMALRLPVMLARASIIVVIASLSLASRPRPRANTGELLDYVREPMQAYQ